jgi:3-mercaptopyruvate sulfurtransferase SseA
MYLITIEELKKKLDRKEDIKLVFTLGEFYYNAMHIPGSIHFDSPEKAIGQIEKTDEIVVYCGSVGCPASIMAYQVLTKAGFTNVRRFAGGLEEWQKAGYELEGEMAS